MSNFPSLIIRPDNNTEDQVLMSVTELAEYLNIGRNHAYNLLRSGEIKSFRIGNSWKVSKEAVNLYIRQKSGLE